jgi:hypothetical protein
MGTSASTCAIPTKAWKKPARTTNRRAKNINLQGMVNSIMQSPEFDTFQDFAFPFGIILYYVFNFSHVLVRGIAGDIFICAVVQGNENIQQN